MRIASAKTGRLSALTARLSSPFLRPVGPGSGSPAAPSDPRAPQTNKEFAEAAIRYCRTLW